MCSCAGVLWVTKRLANVETMRLQANCADQLVLATGYSSLALRRLQHLLIQTPEAASGTAVFAPMLAWLLCRAENLQLLSADLGNILFFPPMTHLKHLVLSLEVLSETCEILKSTSHAVSLETLLVNFLGTGPSPGPSLNLENLRSLQRLALICALPAEVRVWKSCSIFVEGLAVPSMSDVRWSSKMAISHLRYIHWSSEFFGIPASFAGLQNLQDVHLMLGRLGKEGASVSLQNGLANVSRLYIEAENLFITVPAKVQWKEVWFGSLKGAMCITFVDMDAFVSRICQVGIRYKSQIGSWLPKMCRCLAAKGFRYSVRDLKNGGTLFFWGRFDFTRCVCGACLMCLASSQKVLTEWANEYHHME